MKLMGLCPSTKAAADPLGLSRHHARSVAAAAAGGAPQPRPPRGAASHGAPDPAHQLHHQQQQRRELETMQQRWRVARNENRHHREELERQAASGSAGGSGWKAAGPAASGRSPGTNAYRASSAEQQLQMPGSTVVGESSAAVGGGAAAAAGGAPAGLAADLQQLLRALEFERGKGYINVMGREQVRFADWASKQLLHAAGQLQHSPAAAHGCVGAAQRLRQYAAAPPVERVVIVSLAEEAVQQGLRVVQAGSHAAPAQQDQSAPAMPAAESAATAVTPQQQQQPQQQPQRSQQRAQAGEGTMQAMPAPAPAAVPSQSSRTAPTWHQAPPAAPTAAPTAPAAAAAQKPPLQPSQPLPAAAPPAAALVQEPAAAKPAAALVSPDLDAEAAEAHAEESGHQQPTLEGEEYVMRGNRRIKASTAAFRQSFAEAAAALEQAQGQAAARGGQAPLAALLAAGGQQRTDAWLRVRERRLTASAFSKAIGLFDGDRQQLWAEKVGMVEPFAGNDATAWGTSAEPRALEAYQAATGQRIESCMFQVRHDDLAHGWLGASPDGLIESLSLDPSAPLGAPPAASLGAMHGAGVLAGQGRGILEIKCPYNRGQPDAAVQGLMYIFDCEWCNLYIWTPRGGSGVYHIRRDREYWACLWDVLADFWWNHVVPARQEFTSQRWEEVEQYRPAPVIDATEELRQWSKRMALQAPVTFFRPQPAPRRR